MKKYCVVSPSMPRRGALAVALALGLGFSGMALGQATTGSIFGSAPAQSGETVKVTSSTGVTRQVSVENGRFSVGNLPLGNYTVTLLQNGNVVDTRSNVSIRVGAGTNVSFSVASSQENAQSLSAVQVSANAIPKIDVTNVNSSTVITTQQLAKLPLSHSAEAIALLAPGTVKGSGYFGNYVSFGGSSVTENAYYINGFNTTNPLSSFGGMTLPYGSIAQQEILTGGYGAKYGRSDGGVISQIGKRGTNEWHFGGQIRWLPKFLRAEPRNQYLPDGGGLNDYKASDNNWEATYSAYIGGPLIENKLFFFVSAEFDKTEGSEVGDVTSPYKTQYSRDKPSYYAKIDWNINDRNILELTAARNKNTYAARLYKFDYGSLTEGAFNSNATTTKNVDELWIARYTSYITDNLTLTAMYGKLHHTYYTHTPGYDPTYPYLSDVINQNPDLNGGHPIVNPQTLSSIDDPDHRALNTNLRINLAWRIGNHTITFGIDNQNAYDYNDGSISSGPGYSWEYGRSPGGDPTHWIIGGPGTAPNWQDKVWVKPAGNYPGGSTGYYVTKDISSSEYSVSSTQRAQYIEDMWQINDRWMLRIGLRNDQFNNYNPDGIALAHLTSPQWAPRLGVTWDVNGDSSFKIYANAGRYFLALPVTKGAKGAGLLSTQTFYTYTGIDANGVPTGLTPIETSRGTGAPIAPNGGYGQNNDPKSEAAGSLSSEYQDEFILGFDKSLGNAWVYGAKATYRKLRNGIDDVADQFAIAKKMVAMGLVDKSEADQLLMNNKIPSSIMFNPTKTNVFRIPNPNGGYYLVPMSMDDFGFNTKMKRAYWSLDFYLKHPFDGKWAGRITYTLSHSYGNSEGQVRSDIGQACVSCSADWDYAQLMDAAAGDLPNDRRHQLKAFGFYQIDPEWMISGNLSIASGMPRTCLGSYGSGRTNPGLGYGPYYHFCGGKPYPPGKEHNPWEYNLDLGVQYRPSWADSKLAFGLNIHHVLNRRSVRQTYWGYAGGNPYWPSLNSTPMPVYWTTPRYFALSVSYDY